MIVDRDGRHAEQALAVRYLPPGLQRALVGEEGLALHEEQRKGRQTNIGHAVGHLAAPLVGKGRAGRANALQKGLEHLHADLNHTSGRSETYLKINHLELLAIIDIDCNLHGFNAKRKHTLIVTRSDVQHCPGCRPTEMKPIKSFLRWGYAHTWHRWPVMLFPL